MYEIVLLPEKKRQRRALFDINTTAPLFKPNSNPLINLFNYFEHGNGDGATII